jgi:F-type H+-transporting ATPase subunit gamma
MGAQLRVYRRRIRSVQATKKITRAMELIATSRIAKAQQRVQASTPYAQAITETVTIVASSSSTEHILTTEREDPGRVAVLVVTSDRGLAGAYSANALRTAERLMVRLRDEGRDPLPYVVGRKGAAYYSFRHREVGETWTGFSEQPQYENAKEVAGTLIDAFRHGSDDGGVDEIHLIYTRYESMASQRPTSVKLIPLDADEAAADDGDGKDEEGPHGLVEFEPEGEGVLDALLPRYLTARIYAAMLDAAASEQVARRRAMKSATDNADDLIKQLTRDANSARQAEITQEIMEIVGGAEALAGTGSEL